MKEFVRKFSVKPTPEALRRVTEQNKSEQSDLTKNTSSRCASTFLCELEGSEDALISGKRLPKKSLAAKASRGTWDNTVVITILVLTAFWIIIILVLGVPIHLEQRNKLKTSSSSRGLIVPRTYQHGVVVSTSSQCSSIGRDMLRKTGSAVDAAITTAICCSALHPHTDGFGGGFEMMVFDRRKQDINVIDALPRRYADQDQVCTNNSASFACKLGIPGTLAGFWEAHKKFGTARWSELFEPTIKICRGVLTVSEQLGDAIANRLEKIMSSDIASQMFLHKKSRKPLEELDLFLCHPNYLSLLIRLAESENPVSEFYNEGIALSIVEDLKQNGIFMNRKAFADYATSTLKPLVLKMPGKNHTVFIPPQFRNSTLHKFLSMINITNSNVNLSDPDSFADFIKRYIERTHLTKFLSGSFNKKFVSNDQHTNISHIMAVSPDGDSVSLRSDIGSPFGSLVVSNSTGIILNDYFDSDATLLPTSMFVMALNDASNNEAIVISASAASNDLLNNLVTQTLLYYYTNLVDLTQLSTQPLFHISYSQENAVERIYYDQFLPHSVVYKLEAMGYRTQGANLLASMTILANFNDSFAVLEKNDLNFVSGV